MVLWQNAMSFVQLHDNLLHLLFIMNEVQVAATQVASEHEPRDEQVSLQTHCA